MKNKINSIITIILIVLSITISIATSVVATKSSVIDASKKGSITLTVYEYVNGNKENKKVLKGANFTIYKVSDEVEDVSTAENYITNKQKSQPNDLNETTITSDANGKVTFSNLILGRYFIKETDAPKNVLTKVESFLVDIPSVNTDGNGWNYDVVVNPKNVTLYGNVTLNKVDTKGDTISGVKFKLQKGVENVWEDYDLNGMDLITDQNGQINIKNLEAGSYRLIEKEAPNGYIADSLNVQEFTVSLNNTDIVINMVNEKIEVNKYVLSEDRQNKKALGVDSQDVVNWKITSTIPTIIGKMETFKIKDYLSNALDIVDNSLKIYGVNEYGKEQLDKMADYTLGKENQIITINFITQKLINFNNIEIEYQTKINSNVEYGKSITNKAIAEYTNLINQDETEGSKYVQELEQAATAEIHTGKLLILKTDGNKALQGAKFKIATSQEHARAGIFVKDENGNDIVATSDENGHVIFCGLKYGQDEENADNGQSDYWIVEVQAPSYIDEEGQTKYYNLLQNPLKVRVNKNSGDVSNETTTVINKKGFILPKTGAIGMGICTLIGVGLSIIVIIIGKKNDKDEEGIKNKKL